MSARICLPIASCVLAALASGVATAQPPRADDILIEGRQIDRETAERETERIVRQLAVKGQDKQLARWLDPVCPVVHGASAKARRAILGKLRAVALKVGAPLASGKCQPNLVIAFHPTPGEVFKAYAKRSSADIFQLRSIDGDELETGSRTVRWWHNIDVRGASGDQVPNLVVRGIGSDRLRSMVAVEVVSAGILVDSGKVAGEPLAPLAAHVAMIALAPMRMPTAPLAMPSITSLFDGGSAPTDLTDWDRAYLSALYDINPARPGGSQRNRLADLVAQQMDGR
jgi:hypothetical protein